MLVFQNEELPLVSKLFTVGMNSIDWKMIPALALIFFTTVFLVALCFYHRYCCSSRDYGPQMCLFKTFAFQPSILPDLSRKLREGLGGTYSSMLHFQTSKWLPASSPAMKPTAVAGPMGAESSNEWRWPRGSLAPASRSQTGRPCLNLQNCTATNFSCAVLQRGPRVPHSSEERWWTYSVWFFAHE